jgi:hypothetical protein
MDEALRFRLDAIAHRPRVPLPDIRVRVDDWPADALRAAQWVWARRVFNETGSVQLATRLRAAAAAAGLREPAVTSALERLEEDEQAHAALAHTVLGKLGGTPPVQPAAQEQPGEPAEVELARLVLVGLSVCETVSAARYAAVRTHTDLPVFRQCIELFLKDEVVHSRLGFLLLPLALDQLGRLSGPEAVALFVSSELKGVFRELDRTVGLDAQRRGGLDPPRPQPTSNPGVVEPAIDARAFYNAVSATIVPGLEALGLAARAAWSARWSQE